MTKSRANYLYNKYTEEECEQLERKDFLVSEIEEIVNETPLLDENKQIAEMYFIKRINTGLIAVELERDKATIDSRIEMIKKELKHTIYKVIIKNL